MAKKTNKTIYVIIGLVVAVVVAVTAILIINNNKNSGSSEGGGTSNNSYKVNSGELKNVDVEVSYGDYDAMKTLSKNIQNGEMTGKVVKIDGLVSHPGQSYSIVQTSTDGKQKIGTVFNIEDSSEYPADGERVVITAKVLENGAMNFQLFTLKEFVEKQ